MLWELHLQIASLFVVNLQTHVSWAWGYAVPTMAFGLALALFLAGTRLYKFVPPGGSALTRMGQACLFSCSPVWSNSMIKPVDPQGCSHILQLKSTLWSESVTHSISPHEIVNECPRIPAGAHSSMCKDGSEAA